MQVAGMHKYLLIRFKGHDAMLWVEAIVEPLTQVMVEGNDCNLMMLLAIAFQSHEIWLKVMIAI